MPLSLTDKIEHVPHWKGIKLIDGYLITALGQLAEMIRSLHGVQDMEHYGKAVIVTSSLFLSDARKTAEGLRDTMILVDFKQLMAMINETTE